MLACVQPFCNSQADMMRLRTRVSELFKKGKYSGQGISPVIDVSRSTQGTLLLDLKQNGQATQTEIGLEVSSGGDDSGFFEMASLGSFDGDVRKAIPLRDLAFRFLRISYAISPKEAGVNLTATLVTKNFFDDRPFDRRGQGRPGGNDPRRRHLGNKIKTQGGNR